MSTQVVDGTEQSAAEMRLPDGRLVDFEMPEEMPTPAAAGRGETPLRARRSSPVPKSPRRRTRYVAVATALVASMAATTLGVSAVVHVRTDMASQRRNVTELLGRAEAAEQNLDELGRQEQTDAAANAVLNSQLSGLKQSQFDIAGVARQVQPSVVTIITAKALGSGFVVLSRDGTSNIVTNFHVVADVWGAGGRMVSVGLRNGSVQGTIARVSEENDLALVTVAGTLPALSASGGNPSIGDPVLVAGSPRGLAGSVTSGIVSGLRSFGNTPFVQISAPTSPGNSGGPVVDRSGKVLGIVTMKDVGPGSEGLTFAIPFSRVCAVIGVC
ncbi:MAG: S1C family serine protease [Actinomycetota bacterium]|nr:S1C family serine protease [Actinomycetota bacterium]